jgi:hypothetical protein
MLKPDPDPGSGYQIQILIFTFPGSRGQKGRDPGSRSSTLVFSYVSLYGLWKEKLCAHGETGEFLITWSSVASVLLTAQLMKFSYRTGPPGYIG